MNVVEACVPQAFRTALPLVVLAVRIDNQLEGCIVDYFVIVNPLVLRVLPRTFRLIHYVHFAHTHLSLTLAVRIHGKKPGPHPLIIADGSDNQARVCLCRSIWVEAASIDEAGM